MDVILGFALLLTAILAKQFGKNKLALWLAVIGILLIVVTLARCSAILEEALAAPVEVTKDSQL